MPRISLRDNLSGSGVTVVVSVAVALLVVSVVLVACVDGRVLVPCVPLGDGSGGVGRGKVTTVPSWVLSIRSHTHTHTHTHIAVPEARGGALTEFAYGPVRHEWCRSSAGETLLATGVYRPAGPAGCRQSRCVRGAGVFLTAQGVIDVRGPNVAPSIARRANIRTRVRQECLLEFGCLGYDEARIETQCQEERERFDSTPPHRF